MTGDNTLFEDWYLSGGEKLFKPRPQNKILVPLRGSFQNFLRVPLVLFSSWRAIGIVGESGCLIGVNNRQFAIDFRSSQVRQAHSCIR